MKPGHLLKYIKPDGTEINLHSPPSRAVMNMTGWGYLQPDTHTVRGPFQHGTSLLGYRFPERTISFDVVKTNCSRSAWFEERSRLIDRLGIQSANPNLPIVGRLQWEYVENDTIKQRAVDCYLSRGLEFPSDPQWWQTGILSSLEFVANDPFVYDPTQTSIVTTVFDDHLVLPVTFPFLLGCGTATVNTAYAGTWETFPIVTVVGPCNGFRITNTTTNIAIELDYYINTGITVTFDFTPGRRTVTDNLDNNLVSYLKNSNLSQFSLSGNDVLELYVVENTATTSVTIAYYTKYIGI